MIREGKVTIRRVEISDVSEAYVSWLNDEEVTRTIESGGQKQTLKSVREYVEDVMKDESTHFFAILDTLTNKHIGNVKLYDLNDKNKTCGMGIMIGDKAYWRKGYGIDCMRAIIRYAFDELKFHKMWLVTFRENVGQIAFYEKLGFKTEGILERHVIKNNREMDLVYMALFSDKRIR